MAVQDVDFTLRMEEGGVLQELRQLQKEVARLNGLFDKQGTEAKQAGETSTKALNKTEQAAHKAGGEVNSLSSQMKGLAAAAAAFAAANILGGFGKSIIDITAQFQKFKAVLTNTLGSEGAAINSLQLIQDFAAKTPFSVAELTDSFVKLVNSGFKPTEKELTSLGDLAASKGKQLDQLTEAIIDSQTGEFERLKEFGIKASKEGDKVTFTFKGIKTQVDFTQKSIEKYILGLGNLKGVSGSMAAISATLGGKISNLGDTFDSLLLKLGDAFLPLINVVLDIMSDLIGFVKENTSGIKAFAQALADGLKWVAGYGKELLLIIKATAIYAVVFKAVTFTQGLFTVAVGATTTGINAMTTAFQKFLLTLLSNPLVIAAAAVTGLALAFLELEAAIKANLKPIEDLNAELEQAAKNTAEQIKLNTELARALIAAAAGDVSKLEALKTSDFEKLLKARQELLKKNGVIILEATEKDYKDALEAGENNFKKQISLIVNGEQKISEIKEKIANERAVLAERDRIGTTVTGLSKGGPARDLSLNIPELEKQIAIATIEIEKAKNDLSAILTSTARFTFTPDPDAAKKAVKSVKDTAKAITEEVKALETLSQAIEKDAKAQQDATAELQRADVQNLIDLQIEKDQIERDYTLGKFDREKAVFEQEQKIKKAQFDIEKNTQIKAAQDRIDLDNKTIRDRIAARDTAFVKAIAKEKDNLSKLTNPAEIEKQKAHIDKLEAQRAVAAIEGSIEIERIRLAGGELINKAQENINQKELDLLKVQGDAKKALIEKQEKEKGELILKLNNDIFDAENARDKANFEAQSVFHIADLKKFSTIREQLTKEHEERLAKIEREEAEKKNDLQQKGELFTDKIQQEFNLKREKEEREHQDNINKSRREQILTIVDAFVKGLEIFQQTFDTFAQISRDRLQKVIDERNAKIDQINQKAEAGQRINVEQLRIEEERRNTAQAAQERIAQRQIEIAQAVATANAVAAIAKAAAEGGGIASIFTIAATVAALVAGYAAANAATRASTPPLLAEGGVVSDAYKKANPGLLHGKKHGQGGIPLIAEGDEYVISAANSKKYRKELDAINAGKFQPLYHFNTQALERLGIKGNTTIDFGELLTEVKELRKAVRQIPSTSVTLRGKDIHTTVRNRQIETDIAQNRARL